MGLLALAIPFLAFGPGTARAAPPDDLEDHEALEGVDGAAASARFSLKWGDEWSPESGQAEQVLAALDEAWAVQVLELGLPQPDGMAVARLNAYVADTGILVEGERLTLPRGVGGAYGLDPDGWPFIAVSRDAGPPRARRGPRRLRLDLQEVGYAADPTGGATSYVHRCGGAAYGEPTWRCDGHLGRPWNDLPGAEPHTGPIVFLGPEVFQEHRGHYAMHELGSVDYAPWSGHGVPGWPPRE